MASKRRRSRSVPVGAAGCGPFGLFLALGAIYLVVQYWWVIVIAIGVVVLIVALVKAARTPIPPATPRPPKPVRAPKPKPVRAPKPKPLAPDELATHLRALKHEGHVRAMQDWDYEWILLAFPAKSSQEISEIANAHFARGRSIGVNHGDPTVPTFYTPKPRKRSP
jgi:hypothetical protein